MNIIDAEALAFLHMDEHKLFDKLWYFDFESCKRSLGRCNYNLKKITISKWYAELNEEDDVEDTILHEIAHALSFIRYGREGKGHGKLWKRTCREIGAIPERIHKGIIDYPDNHHKYVDTCVCNITFKRHRLSEFRQYRCPKCRQPLFNSKEKKAWLSAKTTSDYLMKEIFGKKS
jgi:predicted SprT family Zn-dependent metalloprotease